jgi:hypothetical protein
MTRRFSFISLTLIALLHLPSLHAQAVEVATIKPHNPAIGGFGMGFRGRDFFATNASLSDLIAFAWVIPARSWPRPHGSKAINTM